MREVTRTEWHVLRNEVEANIADSVQLRLAARLLRSAAMEERILSANDRHDRSTAASRAGALSVAAFRG